MIINRSQIPDNNIRDQYQIYIRNICLMLFGRMFQIISGTSKMVSGTQNHLERTVPNTAHKNVPTNSLLLGTLFLLVFPEDDVN